MSNILLKYPEMEVEQYSFKHPTSFIVSGATQSGKSTFVQNLLANKNDLICPTPKVTYMVYKIWQPIYTEMSKMGSVTKFIQGIPEMKDLHNLLSSHKDDGGSIIIFDDMGSEVKEHTTLFNELFSVLSHHLK